MELIRRAMLLSLIGFVMLRLAAHGSDSSMEHWQIRPTPFRPFNITAGPGALWVCGADEMILSSRDGGVTWETRHQNRDGEVLLNVSFVDEKTGFAGGTGGLLLSTSDGGKTWKRNQLTATVRNFSFADARNGLAIVNDAGPKAGLPAGTAIFEGSVQMTHDGGEHWQSIALSDELRPYTEVLSVAAVDSSHYLMLRRQPNVEDAFVITQDAGKTWKLVHMQNDDSNRVLARTVFVHGGEYWAFGMELVHREKGGGYGVPLTIHSRDGETWTHGVRGPNEFGACNSQGCYLWDGVVEVLYGEHEQFWSMPQDSSLSDKWAIVGNGACTINGTLKCSSVALTERPPARPEEKGITFISIAGKPIAPGCLECAVAPIAPDKPGTHSIQKVKASLTVRRDGSVADISVDSPSKRISKLVEDQLSAWLFEPAHNGDSTTETKKEFSMLLMCSGIPGNPETDRCSLHSLDEFSRPGR